METIWRHLSSKITANASEAVARRISWCWKSHSIITFSGRNEIIGHCVWIPAEVLFPSTQNLRSHTASSRFVEDMSIPVLDLDFQYGPQRNLLLNRLRDALFNVGFLYIKNHHVPPSTISNLIDLLPPLFDLPNESKARISKLNSPCFLGYSGFAEETTLGKKDQREQFDFATDLPVVWQEHESEMEPASGESAKRRHDFTTLYWRLRGPNQWPLEQELPGFRKALTEFARIPQHKPVVYPRGFKIAC